MTEELLPCPFCGESLSYGRVNYVYHDYKEDSKCPLNGFGITECQLESWNTRAALQSTTISETQLESEIKKTAMSETQSPPVPVIEGLDEAIIVLSEHNKWRRGEHPYDGDHPQPMEITPKQLGLAIECVLKASSAYAKLQNGEGRTKMNETPKYKMTPEYVALTRIYANFVGIANDTEEKIEDDFEMLRKALKCMAEKVKESNDD